MDSWLINFLDYMDFTAEVKGEYEVWTSWAVQAGTAFEAAPAGSAGKIPNDL